MKDRPDLFRSVVGGVAMEHFGGLQFAENGDTYAATGKAATTYVWGWPNPLAIAAATKAIKDQAVPRAINDVPARPGVNGKAQLGWLGGGFSRYLVDLGGWPGWHISGDWPSAGFQAYYPGAKTRVSAELFLKQASAAVQLVNVLMSGDVIALAPAWGYLATDIATLDNEAFADQTQAAAGRAVLTKASDRVFDSVKAARYDVALADLPALSADTHRLLTAKDAAGLEGTIEKAREFAERGRDWKAKGLIPK